MLRSPLNFIDHGYTRCIRVNVLDQQQDLNTESIYLLTSWVVDTYSRWSQGYDVSYYKHTKFSLVELLIV